jgi:GntR family transcriptional repressor for pyruvate dehydrogenase complex
VQASAARLREIVLARADGEQIGSLPEVAEMLGVGIVTVQQAARILEHEGLLRVRRGPGGGYYGARPDAAALERSMGAWLKAQSPVQQDALEMMSVLEIELNVAACRCDDEDRRKALRAMIARIDECETGEARVGFEEDLFALLFRMVERPLMELLSRVTLRHYRTQPLPVIFPGAEGVAAWKNGRHRVLEAILARDTALVRFESERHREEILTRLRALALRPSQ